MSKNVIIKELMTRDVFTVDVEDTVRRADEIMREENVRHVPVIEQGKYVGMITDRSIMEYTLRQIYEFDNIDGEVGFNRIIDYRRIMDSSRPMLYPEDSLQKALKLMTKHKLDCLPVVDWDKNLVGVISSVDIMLYFYNLLNVDA